MLIKKLTCLLDLKLVLQCTRRQSVYATKFGATGLLHDDGAPVTGDDGTIHNVVTNINVVYFYATLCINDGQFGGTVEYSKVLFNSGYVGHIKLKNFVTSLSVSKHENTESGTKLFSLFSTLLCFLMSV